MKKPVGDFRIGCHGRDILDVGLFKDVLNADHPDAWGRNSWLWVFDYREVGA